MNVPTKLTVLRIVLTFFIIILLLFPFYSVGVNFPSYNISGINGEVDLKYIIAGIIFIIASLTDFVDGYLARKNKQVTDLGKMLDAIADKILVNSTLIILACTGYISAIIPVIIVLRDTFVDAIKMQAASKGTVVAAINTGKIKTASLMFGIVLAFFYDLPFSLINPALQVSDFLLYLACIMSVISGIQYYSMNKKFISQK